MSIESKIHGFLKNALKYDSGPRFNGTRHNTHRDAMKSSLAAIPGAAQAHQTRRDASAHRDAMKSNLAAIPGRAEALRVGAHQKAMKSSLEALPGAVRDRAAKKFEQIVSTRRARQRTEKKITARMEYNQSAEGKAALAADVATMQQIQAGGPSMTQRMLQGGRRHLGKFSASAQEKAKMIDERNNQASHLGGRLGENKGINQEAQHHIGKAERRETAANVLDKGSAPLGMAVSALATPLAGFAASSASSIASAGASNLAANQRGKAGALLADSSLDRKKGGESLQKEISFMRAREERKRENQNRGEAITKVAGVGINAVGRVVDPTGTLEQVALAGSKKAANLFVAAGVEHLTKYGHDEQQTHLNLQNQLKSLQSASRYHDKTEMGREAMHARPKEAGQALAMARLHNAPARKWPTVRGGGEQHSNHENGHDRTTIRGRPRPQI